VLLLRSVPTTWGSLLGPGALLGGQRVGAPLPDTPDLDADPYVLAGAVALPALTGLIITVAASSVT
jgi:hypothetical protein